MGCHLGHSLTVLTATDLVLLIQLVVYAPLIMPYHVPDLFLLHLSLVTEHRHHAVGPGPRSLGWGAKRHGWGKGPREGVHRQDIISVKVELNVLYIYSISIVEYTISRVLLTGWGQVNNKAVTNVQSPVLVVPSEYLYQIPWLRLLIILWKIKWWNH